MTMLSEAKIEPWRQRLILPNYQIGEAAKYAQISPQTVAAWHRIDNQTLSEKEGGKALSYMQLIEVAVVAAFRRHKITLPAIRRAREFIQKNLGMEFPFAQYKFNTEGRHLLVAYEQIEGTSGSGKYLMADEGGQLEWDEIIGPLLKEFEYEHEGIVIRWHVDGVSSPIVIDPKISFGAPTVKGTPTWIIAGRWNAGESNSAIADDFGLSIADVKKALEFEGLAESKRGKPSRRVLH